MIHVAQYVSGSEKGDHFALKVDYELVVRSHSTVDGLSVALCCASIAAPIPRYAQSNHENTLGATTYEKTAHTPSTI